MQAKEKAVVANEKAKKLNEKYQIEQKLQAAGHAAEKRAAEGLTRVQAEARILDQKYHIQQRAAAARAQATRATTNFVETFNEELSRAQQEQAPPPAGAPPPPAHPSFSPVRGGGGEAPGSSSSGACGGTPTTGDEEGAVCTVCMDAPKTECVRPCGHVCLCRACAVRGGAKP
mmetsp:Transcript_28209/g.89852  ORF Transcript_28209/g.89852 Transcript_28209/m.89852 type:complete len:173 (+) Transcript_28209:117-635(+)